MKARKKPVVVDVFQMTRERRWDNAEWPQWLHMAWNTDPGKGSLWCEPDSADSERLFCGTLEGALAIDWGDWIIRGVEGEVYPCKPSVFEATYDIVGPDAGGL